jgi:hypothetical protein
MGCASQAWFKTSLLTLYMLCDLRTITDWLGIGHHQPLKQVFGIDHVVCDMVSTCCGACMLLCGDD